MRTGLRVAGYENQADSVTVHTVSRDGAASEIEGSLLIGADGLHSVVRAQMYPDQPPVNWGGMILWRGTTLAKPIRTGASFVAVGTHRHRVIFYPITPPDEQTGMAVINWVGEFTVDNTEGMLDGDWNKKVPIDSFIHYFEAWNYDWLDIPAMMRGAEEVFEYPMIDREPVPTWVDGRVALLGDAAHVMYPTGSNGGSQAIVDARVLGANMIANGVTKEALDSFNEQLCAPISRLVYMNRNEGPVRLLRLVDERCGGDFENIDDVIPEAERDAVIGEYKEAAGFAIESLNAAPPTIEPGARVQ
jgi:2-polyprenyl-6-methoxyphenol hydroxylase-like FAD-dependent oxidoreductase